MAAPTLTRRRAGEDHPLRFLDLGLLGAVYALCGLGLVMIYSSTRARLEQEGLSTLYFVERQLGAIIVGTVVMGLVVLVDYRKLRDFAPLGYVVSVVSLVAVLSPLGARSKGTQGWFALPGGFQLQPSEFAKFFLVLALAAFAYELVDEIDLGRLARILGLAAIPIALVLLQPDLGTAMVFGVITITIAAVAGASWKHLAALAALAAVGIAVVIHFGVLADYQVDRLTSFIAPGDDASGAGYNTEQSMTAIGNGGLTGRGLFEGSQTEGSFVPEQHTDFIFTAVGEELGFFGGATVLALLGIVVWRIWRSSVTAADGFGALACVGVLAMFVFQVFENIGMAMGIMPVTGIPLPFMSYGGTSMVVTFACLGLVLNVQMRRFS